MSTSQGGEIEVATSEEDDEVDEFEPLVSAARGHDLMTLRATKLA